MVPSISIIIPAYNVENYILACLESIMNQTYTDFEVICVNDGSTDDTQGVIDKVCDIDRRIVSVSKEHEGVSAARNYALKLAKGKYICFVDSDDYLVPDALTKLFEKMETNQLDIVFFDTNSFFEDEDMAQEHQVLMNNYDRKFDFYNAVKGADLFTEMVTTGNYRTNVVLMFLRRKFLEEIGISFYEGIIHEDNLFTFLCILQAEKAMYIPEKIYNRRIRKDSIMTKRKDIRNFTGYFKCFINMLNFAANTKFTNKTQEAVYAQLKKIYNSTYYLYSFLSKTEKESIKQIYSTSEYFLFEILIGQRQRKEEELLRISQTSSEIKGCKFLKSILKKLFKITLKKD